MHPESIWLLFFGACLANLKGMKVVLWNNTRVENHKGQYGVRNFYREGVFVEG